MIVYASAITDEDVYRRCAEAGIDRLREHDPDAEKVVFASVGSICRNYNLILDQVRGREEVETLVLVHQDAEIVDPEFPAKVLAEFEDPEVAVVGCAGAVDVRSIAWWEGSITWASFTHRYEELGGGEIPALAWVADAMPPFAKTGEVDSVDGFVLALSPWAIENLRFDEGLTKSHGYDLDFCLQARAAGKKVVTANLRVVHHHSLRLIRDVETWIQAHMAVAEKWDHELHSPYGDELEDWKRRARRAEAEASAARLMGGLEELLRVAQYKEMQTLVNSRSWKLMGPARALAKRLRSRG